MPARKNARRAKGADRTAYENEAAALEAKARELRQRADLAAIRVHDLDALKTIEQFENYNNRQQMRADARKPKAKPTEEERKSPKAQRELDERVVKGRHEYQKARVERTLAVSNGKKFGTYGNRKKKNAYDEERGQLEGKKHRIDAHMADAIGYEKRDNERYYEALATDMSKYRATGANRSSVAAVAAWEEIKKLLEERDLINEALIKLYENNDAAVAKKGQNGDAVTLSEILNGTNESYKKLRGLASRIDKLDNEISIKRYDRIITKQDIFDEMNKYVALNAELAELKGQRNKRGGERAYQRKRQECKECYTRIKDWCGRILAKHDHVKGEKLKMILWCIVLALLIAAGVAAYMFRVEIFAYVNALIAQFGIGG